MKNISLKILIIILLLFAGKTYSQRALLDTTIIQVGDQINLKLTIDINKGKSIIFPQFKDTLVGGIEVLQVFDIDTIDNGATLEQKYLITSFEADSIFDIPALNILVDADTLKTNPLILKVDMPHIDSTFIAQIDTTQMLRIRDIKAPIETPLTFAEFWHEWGTIILLSLLAIALVLFVIYYIKRKRANMPIFVAPKPVIPPHITALKELEKLRERKLSQHGKIKKYYTELTDILRIYIEKRFQIPAIEYVSYQTLTALKNTIEPEAHEKLKQILNTADMVKFAKGNPYEHENELNLKHAFAFVELTKPVEIVEEKEEENKEDEK